ncbi:glycosyltransferase [Galbitalea sp. SE-J8]|uniref:glycosyltransferase n=1 Tax=Galbitalea sp. SE-J8 TaxID=3054952 RepID=UPI00259CCFE5|nr:glycosyltransferase [Galbitalea sp. SE-J8]MDM4762853.1 glycosyltransferase [Galbitalea sp. SE-J8]
MPTARTILIASTPVHAHIAPLGQVARALTDAGHRVLFLTGAKFADTVRAAGAEFLPLPAGADFDDERIDELHPGRVGLVGPKAFMFDVRNLFLPPVPAQLAALDAAIAEHDVDVVANEILFLGATAYARRPRAERVPVVSLGIFPLYADDPDVAPAGLGVAPRPGVGGRIRNAVLRVIAQRIVFGALQRDVDAAMRAVGVDGTGTFFMNASSTADAIAQFTVPGFEYPRPTLSRSVRFLGPVATARSVAPSTAGLPEWWGDLDGKTVVHVTQGTVATASFGDLVIPTVQALADRDDVIVVASTGRRDIRLVTDALEPVPANLRITEFLPYDRLLPRVDVMVTNGGYGGVHYALEQGVPLVVAGQTEDKVEVSARIAWSGVGVNLRTQVATPERVRVAVDEVLTDASYRSNAQRIAREIAVFPGAPGIVPLVEELAAGRVRA